MLESIIQLDPVGRILIPSKLRKTMNFRTNDQLHIAIDGDRLIIEKQQNTCALCGGAEALVKTDQKYICKSCYRKLFNGIQIEIACEEKKCIY
ncbi:MAG: AbrB/MazE/SpoVT family DNA-binding domain-containing protein [Clostridiales bacterium]|nr:AbrB/MazE/SpoVT family DNA-binding domain-containing protein [Clostridiales bacterium]